MYKIDFNIYIERSPQDVFDVITDPTKTPLWQSSAESGAWTSNGPTGVGSTWNVVTRFLGRDIEAELQITEWDPPSLVSFKAIDGPVPMEATQKLEPQGDGTLLNVSATIEFGGFFKLAEGLAGKQAEKQMNNDNHILKLLMESNQL